jgi:hypothetical protein
MTGPPSILEPTEAANAELETRGPSALTGHIDIRTAPCVTPKANGSRAPSLARTTPKLEE